MRLLSNEAPFDGKPARARAERAAQNPSARQVFGPTTPSASSPLLL